ERRHERVLDRPLPPLPGDCLGEDLEDDPEVRPDDGADQEHGRQAVDVHRRTARAEALRDEDDRERVRDRPDEERELPPDVAFDEVPVALDDAAEPDQLVPERERDLPRHQSNTSRSSSSAPSASPVAAKNAASSVEAS